MQYLKGHINHHLGRLLYFVEFDLFYFWSLPNILESVELFLLRLIVFLIIRVFSYLYCPIKTISKLLINRVGMCLLFVINFMKHFIFFPYQFINIGSHPVFLDDCCCFREGLIKGAWSSNAAWKVSYNNSNCKLTEVGWSKFNLKFNWDCRSAIKCSALMALIFQTLFLKYTFWGAISLLIAKIGKWSERSSIIIPETMLDLTSLV